MSGRLTILLAGAAMAVAMLAVAGMARAADNLPASTATPTMTSTNPVDGTTGFDRDANIKARFSEHMLKKSINGQTVWFGVIPSDLPCTGGCQPDRVRASVGYDTEKKLAILNPSSRLAKNTRYMVIVEGAGDSDNLAVKDRTGSAMASDYIWGFATGRK